MTRSKSNRLSIAAVTALIPALGVAESELEALQRCQALSDDAARLACYDALSSTPPNEPASPAEVMPAPAPQPVAPPEGNALPAPVPAAETPTAAPPSAPQELDDDIGRENLGQRDGEELVVQGKVVRCREDLTGKYRFYFDNGQVWKQTDNTRIRWKQCDFDVTINKDFFGYRMLVDGERRKIRISRIQ